MLNQASEGILSMVTCVVQSKLFCFQRYLKAVRQFRIMTHKLDPNDHVSPCPAIFLSTEVQLVHFHEPGVSNYSTLLLSEDRDVLYVGAREVIFALNAVNIAEKQHEVSIRLNSLSSI